MQRCPYLSEMRERFWRSNNNGTDSKLADDEGDELLKSAAMSTGKSKQSTIARLAQPEPDDPDESVPMLPPSSTVAITSTHSTQAVSTVVKVRPDGSGSRTVTATERPPSFIWFQQPPVHKWCCNYASKFPKNAKTSLFIISSVLYCKLAVVVCLAFLLSEVVTLNVPLHSFEALFTYLYGGSILFFLYVFCYLLHDSSQQNKDKKKDSDEKDVKKDEEAAADAAASKSGERKQSFLQEGRNRAKYELAERERLDPLLPSESMLKGVKKEGDVNLNENGAGDAGTAAAQPASQSEKAAESGGRKPKISQSDTAHGSVFLRVGTLAFGLGAMIYIGLELGAFFEIPFDSPCHNILRGVNPGLQLIFTFMQMYFIFINARLRIHKFKIIARFGLMHVIATNLCVWIRTLLRECFQEYTVHTLNNGGMSQEYQIIEGNRLLRNRLAWIYNSTTSTTPEPDTRDNGYGGYYAGGAPISSALNASSPILRNVTCNRTPYMGTVVSDAAPYLFPVVIEYSLIAAAVVFIIWRSIGRGVPTKGTNEEGDDNQQECWEMGTETYSRYTGTEGPNGPVGPVDCIGASKGLFCGLLLLVAALICLILFFVLVNREQYRLLAIYLCDCSHAGLLFISFLATLIGFVRVRQLRFHGDHGSPLRDILLRVSILGVFAYALFSLISGTISSLSLQIPETIPSILVGGTAIVVILQVILQMLFISDVGRRRIHMPEHARTKPGRQIVTFLLITNLTMWAIVTLEIRKVDSDPVQRDFYGVIPWAMVQRFALPLYIFHRFFSAVTLAEIWKNSYTLKYIPVAAGP